MESQLWSYFWIYRSQKLNWASEKGFPFQKEKKLIRENHFSIPFDSCLTNYGGDKMAGLALQEPSWRCEARHHHSAMGSTKAEEAGGLNDGLSTPGSILGLLFLVFLETHLSLAILVYQWDIHFTTSEFVLRTLCPLAKSFTFQWNLSSFEAELLWILFTVIFLMLERAQEQDRYKISTHWLNSKTKFNMLSFRSLYTTNISTTDLFWNFFRIIPLRTNKLLISDPLCMIHGIFFRYFKKICVVCYLPPTTQHRFHES